MRAANKRDNAANVDESGRRANAAQRARRLAAKQAEAMPVVEAAGPRKARVVEAELISPVAARWSASRSSRTATCCG